MQAGSEFSRMSGRIIALIGQAEAAITGGDHDAAADLLVAIAEIVFAMDKFAPENPLPNWDTVLRHWVHGAQG